MKKLLIITGASRGIGYKTAEQFLKQGYEAINISRSPCSLDKVVNLTIDLSDPTWEQQQDLMTLSENAESITLVHNAAFYHSDTVKNCNSDTLRKVMEVNIIAPMMLNKLILPTMNPGSSIIYIGSTLSEKAVKNNASYVTSKHAVAGLMKATCQDLDNTNIHTCCVCPGVTNTEMLQQRIGGDKDLLHMLENLSSQHRLIDPDEIAQLIWFCSQHPVINGAIIHGNLGQIET